MVRRIRKLPHISFILPLFIILLAALIFIPLAFLFPKIFNFNNIFTQPNNLIVGTITLSITIMALFTFISNRRTEKEIGLMQKSIDERLSEITNKPINNALERKKKVTIYEG